MFKNLVYLFFAALLIVACNSATKSDFVTLTVEEFDQKCPELVDQNIEISGTVVHVCKHGGKRLFLIGSDSAYRIEVTTGEKLAAFNPEMEGYEITINGKVHELRIDEAYLTQWENEVRAGTGDQESDLKVHDGAEGHEHNEGAEGQFAQIQNFRDQIKAAGSDHISLYSVIAESFKIKEN